MILRVYFDIYVYIYTYVCVCVYIYANIYRMLEDKIGRLAWILIKTCTAMQENVRKMLMCIHVYMYSCMCIHISVYNYVYICVYMYMYTHMYTCMYVYFYVFIYMCIYIHVYYIKYMNCCNTLSACGYPCCVYSHFIV